MFGIDFETLVILAILAFILFGPEKLPEYAAKLGYYLAKLRQASSDLSREYNSSFSNLLQPPPAVGPPPPPNQAQAPPAAAEAAYQPTLAGAQAQSAPRTCPQCSAPVGVDFVFCPKCGQLLPRQTAADLSQHLSS